MAIINLFPADSSIDLAMFICDDGNFHTTFPAEERELITAVARAAGLEMGGVEICSTYYSSSFR